MALQNSDLFLVGRGSTPHKITYANLKTKLTADGVSGISEAPSDGKQYGRQNNSWTEIVSGGGGSGSGGASSGFLKTPQTLTSDQDIGDFVNAACIGPMAVGTGVTVTIGANSKLSVLNF